MTSMTILVRILVSALLGGLIGIERELHGCAAGLRTHILVCVGSTLFMMTSIIVAIDFNHIGDVDASRIAAGVVTGIGFLGAGAIMRYGASVRGLTTAASIWAVAAVGLATGASMYEAAGMTTVVCLAVLILSRLEERMELKRPAKKLKIVVFANDSSCKADDIKRIIDTYDGKIKKMMTKDKKGGREFVFDLVLARSYRKDILFELSSLSKVKEVKWL
ncbi:MAG: MgtC/SapB family protein [Candidatus Omnitrophica bacterium]|nr:MgtC/SapB family protein [Candidatus Omnitrophota bacterium]